MTLELQELEGQAETRVCVTDEGRASRRAVEEVTACSVLVLNASREIAKEITHQLTLNLPGCSLTFSPSIELARWILKRRKIDLVVSSPRLPDGGIEKLRRELSALETPPDLVVVGQVSHENVSALGSSGYHFASWKRLGQRETRTVAVRHDRQRKPKMTRQQIVRKRVKDLGADIRNDLNNPLQEIVAMVFVAQQTANAAPTTDQALEAIDTAAKNMAKYVNSLEEKIEIAVNQAPA